MLQNQGKLLFQRNNSFAGSIERRDGSKGWVNNANKGAPDLYVFLLGKTLHVELKATKGKQSPAQLEWQKKCAKLGHEYYVIYDLDVFQKLLVLKMM